MDEISDDPEIIKLMISYFYQLDYDASLAKYYTKTSKEAIASSSQTAVFTHAKIFAAAVKYQIDGLRDLSAAKFAETVKTTWNSYGFAEAIGIVFQSTTEEVTQLRDIVTDILHDNFKALKDKPEIETAVCEIPRLAYALLKRKSEKPKPAPTATNVKPITAAEHRICQRFRIGYVRSDANVCDYCYNLGYR